MQSDAKYRYFLERVLDRVLNFQRQKTDDAVDLASIDSRQLMDTVEYMLASAQPDQLNAANARVGEMINQAYDFASSARKLQTQLVQRDPAKLLSKDTPEIVKSFTTQKFMDDIARLKLINDGIYMAGSLNYYYRNTLQGLTLLHANDVVQEIDKYYTAFDYYSDAWNEKAAAQEYVDDVEYQVFMGYRDLSQQVDSIRGSISSIMGVVQQNVANYTRGFSTILEQIPTQMVVQYAPAQLAPLDGNDGGDAVDEVDLLDLDGSGGQAVIDQLQQPQVPEFYDILSVLSGAFVSEGGTAAGDQLTVDVSDATLLDEARYLDPAGASLISRYGQHLSEVTDYLQRMLQADLGTNAAAQENVKVPQFEQIIGPFAKIGRLGVRDKVDYISDLLYSNYGEYGFQNADQAWQAAQNVIPAVFVGYVLNEYQVNSARKSSMKKTAQAVAQGSAQYAADTAVRAKIDTLNMTFRNSAEYFFAMVDKAVHDSHTGTQPLINNFGRLAATTPMERLESFSSVDPIQQSDPLFNAQKARLVRDLGGFDAMNKIISTYDKVFKDQVVKNILGSGGVGADYLGSTKRVMQRMKTYMEYVKYYTDLVTQFDRTAQVPVVQYTSGAGDYLTTEASGVNNVRLGDIFSNYSEVKKNTSSSKRLMHYLLNYAMPSRSIDGGDRAVIPSIAAPHLMMPAGLFKIFKETGILQYAPDKRAFLLPTPREDGTVENARLNPLNVGDRRTRRLVGQYIRAFSETLDTLENAGVPEVATAKQYLNTLQRTVFNPDIEHHYSTIKKMFDVDEFTGQLVEMDVDLLEKMNKNSVLASAMKSAKTQIRDNVLRMRTSEKMLNEYERNVQSVTTPNASAGGSGGGATKEAQYMQRYYAKATEAMADAINRQQSFMVGAGIGSEMVAQYTKSATAMSTASQQSKAVAKAMKQQLGSGGGDAIDDVKVPKRQPYPVVAKQKEENKSAAGGVSEMREKMQVQQAFVDKQLERIDHLDRTIKKPGRFDDVDSLKAQRAQLAATVRAKYQELQSLSDELQRVAAENPLDQVSAGLGQSLTQVMNESQQQMADIEMVPPEALNVQVRMTQQLANSLKTIRSTYEYVLNLAKHGSFFQKEVELRSTYVKQLEAQQYQYQYLLAQMNQQQQALMSDINQQTTISQQLTAQIQSQALQYFQQQQLAQQPQVFYQGAQPQVVLTNDDLQAQIQTAKIELNDLRKDAIVKLSNFVKHMNSGSVADLVIFGKSLPNAGTGGQIKKLIDVVNVNLKQAAMNIQYQVGTDPSLLGGDIAAGAIDLDAINTLFNPMSLNIGELNKQYKYLYDALRETQDKVVTQRQALTDITQYEQRAQTQLQKLQQELRTTQDAFNLKTQQQALLLERTGRRELDKLEDRDIEMMSLAQSDELRLKSLRDQIQAKQQAISSFQQLRSQMGVDQVEAGERLKQLKDEYKMLKANNGEMERQYLQMQGALARYHAQAEVRTLLQQKSKEVADTVDSLGAALRGSDSNKLASETAAAAQRLINATFNTPKNALAVLSQAGLQKLRYNMTLAGIDIPVDEVSGWATLEITEEQLVENRAIYTFLEQTVFQQQIVPPEVKKRLSDTLSSLQQQAISHMSTIAQFDLQGKLFATLNAAAVPDEGAIARLREVLTSQNVPDKVRRAMQGIAVSKNFISSFKTELLPQLVDLDTQYTGIKKLLGENDAGNLLEFQQTMQTAMTDLVTGMQTATQSQQSSTNVEAATAAIRKSLDNMAKLKTQLSTQRGETIFNLYQGTVKENVKKMVSVMRAHNDPRGKQLGQEMVANEAAIRDFFDTLATTQKRFVKNNLQQLIAAARTSNVVNPIAVAADSDDIFEEVFAQVQRLGGAELSNYLRTYAKNTFKELGEAQAQEVQRLLASTLNQEVQQLVEGISVRQLQNAIVKPQSIAREYFTMLVGGQQVPEEYIRGLGAPPGLSNRQLFQVLDEVRTAHADRTRAITNSVVFEEMKAPEEIEERQQEYAAQTRDRLRTTAETAKSVIRGENIRFSEVNDTNLRIFQRMGTSRGGLVAAGDGSTRSLYDLAGANVDVFRKNISTMAKKEVEKVEKELQQSIPTMYKLAAQGHLNEGDQIVFNDDGTLAKITQYYGAAMAGQLYEEGAITNEQVRMVVSQLNNSERSFSDVLKLLATTVNDPGVFKRALQVFAEGVASNVEGSATFYIQNMQPVPQAVVESITNHRFFLDQFKAFVEGEGNVEQMISHADRILPERQQIPVMVQSLARYAHDVVSNVQKEVLEYNKTVGEHNLLQTEEALKILRGRGVIAAHEEKINEAVQKKTDFVYEGVERMLQKMLLRNGDLSQNGNDDRQGRYTVRGAVQNMFPRAYYGGTLAQRGSEVAQQAQQPGAAGGGKLFEGSRLRYMQRLAKIDRGAVQFLQSVSIDKNSGQPLINGQPLTPEQRKRLAQLIVSVMIAMYAVVHRGTQKAAQIVQDRNNLVREAQDDDNLPRFAAAINDLFRHKVRGRRLEEDKV